jgi:hypothetical protein
MPFIKSFVEECKAVSQLKRYYFHQFLSTIFPLIHPHITKYNDKQWCRIASWLTADTTAPSLPWHTGSTVWFGTTEEESSTTASSQFTNLTSISCTSSSQAKSATCSSFTKYTISLIHNSQQSRNSSNSPSVLTTRFSSLRHSLHASTWFLYFCL